MVVAAGGLVSSWAMSLYAGRSSELGFVYSSPQDEAAVARELGRELGGDERLRPIVAQSVPHTMVSHLIKPYEHIRIGGNPICVKSFYMPAQIVRWHTVS